MDGDLPKLAIVIQTKSNLECLLHCINTIRFRCKYPNYKLYIADTGSSFGELKNLKENLQSLFHDSKNCTLLQFNYWHYGKINNIVGNKGVDITIETTGNTKIIEQAYKLTAADGKTILVGVPKMSSPKGKSIPQCGAV